jgi:hypothetical protein
MKKSLVLVTVLFAVVAFASSVVAAGPVCAPAPAPVKSKQWTETQKGKIVEPIGPKAGKATAPKTVTVPCNRVMTIPGKVAYGPTPTGKWVPVKGKVYNILCQGKTKGACPAGCLGKVTWAAKWTTLAEAGTVKYKIFYPAGAQGTKKMQILVKEKKVPLTKKCAF